jgi:hypothetical protein
MEGSKPIAKRTDRRGWHLRPDAQLLGRRSLSRTALPTRSRRK